MSCFTDEDAGRTLGFAAKVYVNGCNNNNKTTGITRSLTA